jgi:cell shape-determining protein MreC
MEETCCVYKQEREKIENEFNKRLNEYVDTISQLRKYLRDKEKENEELKTKLLKDNKSNKC